jgi:hypothetical protein
MALHLQAHWQHSFCPAGKDTVIVSPEGISMCLFSSEGRMEKKKVLD